MTTHSAQVPAASTAEGEIAQGERFAFGKNWSRFLQLLDDDRIREAESSVRKLLGRDTLKGLSLLDIGSGSGLFSLAARRLGAKVHSFDYDPNSVACTAELKRRYFPDDPDWTVAQGSILDPDFVDRLPQTDVVYSWGVLHHTGDMWTALENAARPVKPGGTLAVAIYNDQEAISRRWLWVKRRYVSASRFGRGILLAGSTLVIWWRDFLKDFLYLRPFATWRSYGQNRGMSAWHDMVDWVGGYPFEVARPEEIFEFFRKRGFRLERLKTCGAGKGCNEFVFVHEADSRP